MSRIIRDGEQVKNLCFDRIEAGTAQGLRGSQSPDNIDVSTLIEDTHRKVNSMIKGAEERSKEIEREAYQKGYRDGLDLAEKEITEEIKVIKMLAKQALEEKWRAINNIEDDIVGLALEIAEKVIDEQVKLKQDIIVNVAKKALMMTAAREHLQIRVNPGDLELMRNHKEDLSVLMDGIEKIEVIADRRIKQGGCIFETSAGNVDARIQSQLSQIGQSLREVVTRD